jgi:hypothetical protein
MSLENEFNAVSSAVSKDSDYESNPGRYQCTIEGYTLSPSDHKGTPYFIFKLKTQNDKTINAKLWRAKAGDSPEKANNKNAKIKQFIENAGVDMSSLKGEQVLKALIGKQLNCAFTQSEYIGYDKKNNGKPRIGKSLNFFYSGPIDKELTPVSEDKAYQRLSEADKMQFQQELDRWNMNNQGGSNAISSAKIEAEDHDNLPF